MSERKQTPDVLADILGASAASPAPLPTPARSPSPAARRRPAPENSSEPARRTDKLRRWEYVVVSCQDYHGWRPRYESGAELAGWMRGPLLHSYLQERGHEGWELVAATSGRPMFGVTDCYQLFLRKPIE
jgi:hypothetical protein